MLLLARTRPLIATFIKELVCKRCFLGRSTVRGISDLIFEGGGYIVSCSVSSARLTKGCWLVRVRAEGSFGLSLAEVIKKDTYSLPYRSKYTRTQEHK